MFEKRKQLHRLRRCRAACAAGHTDGTGSDKAERGARSPIVIRSSPPQCQRDEPDEKGVFPSCLGGRWHITSTEWLRRRRGAPATSWQCLEIITMIHFFFFCILIVLFVLFVLVFIIFVFVFIHVTFQNVLIWCNWYTRPIPSKQTYFLCNCSTFDIISIFHSKNCGILRGKKA